MKKLLARKNSLNFGIVGSGMKNRLVLFWGVVLGLVVLGCGGGGTAVTEDEPLVYFVNASTDAGAIDIKMDDVIAENDLAYKSFSTDFAEFEFKDDDPDGYDVSFHDGTTDAELDRRAFVFSKDTSSVVVAHGIRNFASGEDLKRLRMAAFVVNRQVVNGNRCRLIVFHGLEAGTGLFTPSVVFKNPGSNPQFQTQTINPGTVQVIEVDSGNQSWEVKRSDTEGIFVSTSSLLTPGAVYVVLISGVDGAAFPADQPSVTFIKLATTS